MPNGIDLIGAAPLPPQRPELPPEGAVFFQLMVPTAMLQADGSAQLQLAAQAGSLREIYQAIASLKLGGKRHVIIGSTILIAEQGMD